jgi:hypothetical protein
MNDLFMFGAGIVACHHGWLERSLQDQLNTSVPTLRLVLILEGTAMSWLILHLKDSPWVDLLGALISGLYYLDMSLAVLQAFQSYYYLDFQTPWDRFLSCIYSLPYPPSCSCWLYITLGLYLQNNRLQDHHFLLLHLVFHNSHCW